MCCTHDSWPHIRLRRFVSVLGLLYFKGVDNTVWSGALPFLRHEAPVACAFWQLQLMIIFEILVWNKFILAFFLVFFFLNAFNICIFAIWVTWNPLLTFRRDLAPVVPAVVSFQKTCHWQTGPLIRIWRTLWNGGILANATVTRYVFKAVETQTQRLCKNGFSYLKWA